MRTRRPEISRISGVHRGEQIEEVVVHDRLRLSEFPLLEAQLPCRLKASLGRHLQPGANVDLVRVVEPMEDPCGPCGSLGPPGYCAHTSSLPCVPGAAEARSRGGGCREASGACPTRPSFLSSSRFLSNVAA